MTRIDFYLLPTGAGGPVPAVCRLCEKASSAGQRVYVRALEAGLAGEIDGALWSFRQGGFIAHERFGGQAIEDPQPPVLIGAVEPPDSHRAILLNLGEDVPGWFSSFERVLEVVPEDPQARARSRERYKFYKDRGYELKTYEQSPEGAWKLRE